jgi:signal transduction histidine kinase/HAMP domain-containing protein
LRRLDDLANYRPDVATVLRQKVAEFEQTAMHAVDLYTDDKRVLGNTILAEARQHSVTINDRLSTLIDDLHHEVVQGRDLVVADVARTTQIAYLTVAGAIILGMTATLVVLGSILVPLRRLVSAIEGITAGDLNVPIPAAARNEIGTMANTLRLFRESIVERARLAEEGDRQRRMIETSIETIPDGFVLYDPDDCLILCNSKYRELTPGIADLIVPGVAFVNILCALADRGMVDLEGRSAEEWIAERLRQHSDPDGFPEYLYNGTWVRISERRTPDGSMVSVLTDITELKQRQAELQEAMEQAATASQHKSQFLANMSHELRTPLNAILGYTELVIDGYYGVPPAKMGDVLKRIEANGKHLLGLINAVLDLSKIEADQLVLELTDYSLKSLVQTVCTVVESLAADKKIALKTEISTDLPLGRGDERRLTQVLLNLVGNAIKFTDAGEVVVEASATSGAFNLSVRDTGPGISPSDQAKLFHKFQQGDHSIARTKGGTGLGLAISKRIVEVHGGRIWVESVVGQGSTFFVTVPVKAEQARSPSN